MKQESAILEGVAGRQPRTGVRLGADRWEEVPTLENSLAEAEQLVIYAASAGIKLDPATSSLIIRARRSGPSAWQSDDVGALMAAIASVAASVHPVTADGLVWCRTLARQQIAKYTWIAALLAALIVPLSILSFITTGFSTSIAADLTSANQLAVDLHSQLDPSSQTDKTQGTTAAAPANSLAQLQQFAVSIRSIDSHASQLDHFLLNLVPTLSLPDDKLELPPGLWNSASQLRKETNWKTTEYQNVRRYAVDVQNWIGLCYGAVANFVLPILYALLGACAFLLRTFSKELESGSFSNSYGISARFFIAAIGGMIIGLFNNFTVTGATLSPLALAFLVGYAADVFFSFLESLLQSFKKPA